MHWSSKLVLCFLTLVFSSKVNAQLASEFLGFYVSDDFSTSIEFKEDPKGTNDFTYLLERTNKKGVTELEEGYGTVLNEGGIELVHGDSRLRAVLEIDEYGIVNLFMNLPGEKQRMHFTFSSITENEEEALFMDVQLFFSENGDELDLFENYGMIGFRLLTSDSDPCGVREFSGFMNPQKDDYAVLYYVGENGCELEFLSSEKGIYINHKNCNEATNCSDFSGMYFGPAN